MTNEQMWGMWCGFRDTLRHAGYEINAIYHAWHTFFDRHPRFFEYMNL